MHKGSLLCRYKIICGEFRLSLPSATAINSESLTVFAEKKPGLPVAPRFVRIFSSSCLYKKRPGLSLICKNSLDEYSKKCCLLLLRRRVNLLVSNLCCRRRVHAINRILQLNIEVLELLLCMFSRHSMYSRVVSYCTLIVSVAVVLP